MSRSARRKFQESRRRRAGAPPFGDPHADLIALWALRMLLDLNGLRKYESVFFLNQATIFRAVGLHPAPTEDVELPELRKLLLKRHEEVEALKPEGTLTRSGLVRLHNNGGQSMQLKFSLLKGFSESMFMEQSDPIDLMRFFFRLAEPSHLSPEDFSHIQDDYQLLLRYLQPVENRA